MVRVIGVLVDVVERCLEKSKGHFGSKPNTTRTSSDNAAMARKRSPMSQSQYWLLTRHEIQKQ